MSDKYLFIVDDDSIFRLLTTRMLRNLEDHTITAIECVNGEHALEQFATIGNVDVPIFVLLDINMPLVNGWEFLERLREQNYFGHSKIAVYIMSSSVDAKDVDKSQRYDVVKGFIHKPLSIEKLAAIMADSFRFD